MASHLPENKRLRYEEMLFNYETTSKADYRGGEIRETAKSCKRVKASPRVETTIPEPVSKFPVKYVHTLREWRNYMPFDALIKPKEILQVSPWVVQAKYEKYIDTGREEAQRTRPRLIMTPAVSIDDVVDPVKRNIVIQDMYTTEMSFKLREAAQNSASATYHNMRSPLPVYPAPANPIFLPKLKPPYVSTEWRMDSVTWDNRQLRGHCEPTAEFWLSPDHKPTRCYACDQTAVNIRRKNMLNRMRR